MKHMLSRPARAILPALLASAAFMRGGNRVLDIAAAILLARLCSLCAGGALRTAAASVVNTARLRGNLITAVFMAIVGCAIVAALRLAGVPYICEIPYFTIFAGGLINLAQVLSDRMYASPDTVSPPMFDFITAVFCVFGLLVSDIWLFPALCAVPVLAGCILLFGLRRGAAVKPGFRIFPCAPGAMLRGGIFPALLTAGVIYIGFEPIAASAALAGWAILDGFEPTFRRSGDERAFPCVILTAISAACAVCAALIGEIWAVSLIAVMFACLCAQAVGFRQDIRRLGICLVQIVAAAAALEVRTGFVLTPMVAAIIACAASVAALILLIPDIKDIRRVAHARRLQKRRSMRI